LPTITLDAGASPPLAVLAAGDVTCCRPPHPDRSRGVRGLGTREAPAERGREQESDPAPAGHTRCPDALRPCQACEHTGARDQVKALTARRAGAMRPVPRLPRVAPHREPCRGCPGWRRTGAVLAGPPSAAV